MYSSIKRLTVDSISAGIVSGAILGWVVNVIDLGLLRPMQLNLWRQLAGLEMLPLDYWALLRRELGAFNRWWYVIVLSMGVTLSLVVDIRQRLEPRRRKLQLMLFSWLLTALTFELYYFPTSGEGFADWITRAFLSLGLAAVLALGVVPCVRVAMNHFAEV